MPDIFYTPHVDLCKRYVRLVRQREGAHTPMPIVIQVSETDPRAGKWANELGLPAPVSPMRTTTEFSNNKEPQKMSNIIHVDFHGDDVLCYQGPDGQIYVFMRKVCENLGLDWSAQWRRIERDPVLGPSVAVMATEAVSGVTRDQVALPLKYLNGWLFGVNVNRIKPELKERLIQYKRDCYEVLANHFLKKSHTVVTSSRDVLELPEDAERWINLLREARCSRGRRYAARLWDASPLAMIDDTSTEGLGGMGDKEQELADWINLSLMPCEGARAPIGNIYARAAAELGFRVDGRLFTAATQGIHWAQDRRVAAMRGGARARCLMDVAWKQQLATG